MPYVGKKPADIIATAIDTTTGTFSGVVDADAGITVDNITIDGTEIDLSSGDLTLDVAGDIILDADGGDIRLSDAGTQFGKFTNSSSDFIISSSVNDKDIKFAGADGGANITALTLDMSDAGAATLNNGLTLTDGNLVVANGHGIDFSAASGSASGSASALLDDYEEGTWTPTSAIGTLSHAYAYYIKIGRRVTVSAKLSSFSDRSTNTTITITNLPFTRDTSYDNVAGGSAMWSYVNQEASVVYIAANGLEFYKSQSGDYDSLTHSELNNSGTTVYLFATFISS